MKAGATVAAVVAVLTLVLLAAIFLRPARPASKYERTTWYCCRTCGTRRTLYEEGRPGSPEPTLQKWTAEETALSAWYANHIAPGCTHSELIKLSSDTTNYTYNADLQRWDRATPIQSRTLRITLRDLLPADRARLETVLQKEGVEACKRLIRYEIKRLASPPGTTTP